MPAHTPTPGALRQRRFRRRRKHDLILAQAEVPMHVAENLIDAGLLFEEDASDPQALGGALVEAAERLINDGR